METQHLTQKFEALLNESDLQLESVDYWTFDPDGDNKDTAYAKVTVRGKDHPTYFRCSFSEGKFEVAGKWYGNDYASLWA